MGPIVQRESSTYEILSETVDGLLDSLKDQARDYVSSLGISPAQKNYETVVFGTQLEMGIEELMKMEMVSVRSTIYLMFLVASEETWKHGYSGQFRDFLDWALVMLGKWHSDDWIKRFARCVEKMLLDAEENLYADPTTGALIGVIDLIGNASNIKIFKEMPFFYEQLGKDRRAELLSAINAGKSPEEVRALAKLLLAQQKAEDNGQDPNDIDPDDVEDDPPVTIVLKAKMSDDGRYIISGKLSEYEIGVMSAAMGKAIVFVHEDR